MPYTHKKEGNKYVVYKGGKKVGETKGTKEALKKYLAALHINADKDQKALKESILALDQPETVPTAPTHEDEVGNVYVVLKPHPEMDAQGMVHQSDVFGVNRFSPENIHGVYNDEDRATGIAEKLVREMHVSMAQLEEKKGKVSDKLQKAITKLQKQINKHMDAANEDPANADEHQAKADNLMQKIKSLRHKHKMVEGSRKQLPQNEEL